MQLHPTPNTQNPHLRQFIANSLIVYLVSNIFFESTISIQKRIGNYTLFLNKIEKRGEPECRLRKTERKQEGSMRETV
jgi:hypothetical protein